MSAHHQPETLQVGVEPLQCFTSPALSCAATPPTPAPPVMRTTPSCNDGPPDRSEVRVDEPGQAMPGNRPGTTG
jgi:hypothetical protein